MAQGVFGGFLQGQATTQARQQFPLEQQLRQLRNQQVQQGLEQSAAEFPLQQQLLQQRIAQQQAAFPIQQQLDQLRIQEGRLGVEQAQQQLAATNRDQRMKDIVAVGNIMETVKGRNIQDPKERFEYMQTLLNESGIEAVLDPGDEAEDKIDIAIAARDSLLKRNPGKFNIGSRTIKEDGTVVASTDQGPIVWDPSGRMLKGEEASRQIRSANEYETRLQKDRSFGRGIGAQSVELSGKAFEQLPKIRKNIANLNEALNLLDRGAKTGPVYSLLPSVSDAAVELDNLQAQLGLDVIGNTTFGALSEGELKLALNTALPKNLKQDALRDWITKKRDAQSKLASYIQDAAQFFGRGGNISDFLELQKNAQASGVTQEERVESSADQASPQVGEGAIIRNPTTGQQKQLVNGQWVDI